ncbi:MAG: glycosyltransferase [Actinomycetota bacterium]
MAPLGRDKADLALVLPCYNESRRLPRALDRLEAMAAESGVSVQLVIVDDGSTDDTAEIALSRPSTETISFELVRITHRGKGAAVRAGMSVVQAPVVGYCDADLSAGPETILDLYAKIKGGADMAIASREAEGSVLVVRQRWYRERAGRAFNLILRTLCRIPFKDTQCGLKLMRDDVAGAVFRNQRLDGFAFDAEVVILAVRLGFSVEEAPLHWAHDDDSKLSFLRDSFRMARDMFRIVRRLRKGTVHRPGVPTEEAIDRMAASERGHWWYAAKRSIVIESLASASAGPCLDVGCGGGATLAEIAHERPVFGVDLSLRALGHARESHIEALAQSEAGSLPFRSGTFPVVLALDVVEHHARPEILLAEIRRVLDPSGTLVVTVPAYQWMWSYSDHVLGHYRRYTRKALAKELTDAGFRVVRLTHFHSWLVGPAWLFRRLRSLIGKTSSADDFEVPGPLNGLLRGITRLEMGMLRRRDIPFGLSILAVVHPDARAAGA